MARRDRPAATDRCPRCDGALHCGAATGGCWCNGATLTPELRDELAKAFDGCLCPACLRELAAPPASTAPSLP